MCLLGAFYEAAMHLAINFLDISFYETQKRSSYWIRPVFKWLNKYPVWISEHKCSVHFWNKIQTPTRNWAAENFASKTIIKNYFIGWIIKRGIIKSKPFSLKKKKKCSVQFCDSFIIRLQWGSEYPTSLVLEWWKRG